MTDEKNTLPANEVSRRIVTGVRMVYELYIELFGFLRMLRESLQNTDLELHSHTGSSFHLPLGSRKTRTVADKYMSVDLGILFEVAGSEMTDEEEEVDEVEDENVNQRRGIQITPDSQFLAVRAQLYDRTNPDPDSFRPTVFAVLLDQVTKTSRSKKEPSGGSNQFVVPRNHFLGIVKSIDAEVSQGDVLTQRVTRGQVNVNVSGIVSRPLAEFTSETEVQEFVDQIVKLAGE